MAAHVQWEPILFDDQRDIPRYIRGVPANDIDEFDALYVRLRQRIAEISTDDSPAHSALALATGGAISFELAYLKDGLTRNIVNRLLELARIDLRWISPSEARQLLVGAIAEDGTFNDGWLYRAVFGTIPREVEPGEGKVPDSMSDYQAYLATALVISGLCNDANSAAEYMASHTPQEIELMLRALPKPKKDGAQSSAKPPEIPKEQFMTELMQAFGQNN